MADAASEGARGSEATSSATATQRKKKERHTDGQSGDLLEEKKSAEEALHASMYALVKEKGSEPWQYSYFKIVMEGLVALLIVFNTERQYWHIDEQQWLWKIVRWPIFRSPIVFLFGYQTYTQLLFALAVIIFTVLVGIAFLAWSMRKQDHPPWLKTLAAVLQVSSDLLFSVLYMAILDYLLFFFSCDYGAKPITHMYFTDVQCMSMPHMTYLAVAALTAIVVALSAVAVQTAGCDLNPTAMGLLASPAATMKLKVVAAKAIFITACNLFTFMPKPQALLMLVMCMYILWLNMKTVPFLHDNVNYVWCGMWTAVLYTVALYLAMAFSPLHDDMDYRDTMTRAVLIGVWPMLLAGGLVTYGWHSYRMRAALKFADPEIDRSKLKKVHRFSSAEEVGLLCRAMRKFDLDGVVDSDAADMGELIIKAGLATFPNSPQLLILLANFMMEVRKDGPASRTQLQIVAKHAPNFVERYQVFCTVENSKRLKESNDQGMDLHSYVEFKRNFRAAVRVHKDALIQVRDMWSAMLKSEPKMSRIDASVREADTSIDRAYRVYRKVVERYPKNGKLLRVYGSFLEDVKSDFKNAMRVYAQAMRQGGVNNGLLSMDFDFVSQPGKPDMLLSMDINEDAIVLCNADGMMMMASAGITPMFGYNKGELEGQNLAMLMPPPFNQRHTGYMQHYKETGEARILDSVREMVALHKDKHVFPCNICVTKLSGLGADAVFLGLLRMLPYSKRDVRSWLAPNGVIMCCGPMFSAITGIIPEDMVGTNVKSMMGEPEAFDKLLQRGMVASQEEFDNHSLSLDVTIFNKYLGPIPCHVYFTMGGTESTRVIVLHIDRIDEADDNLLVVDEHGQVTFATIDLAVTLGYTLKQFMKLNLKQLLPAPINAMHEKWLVDAPPSHPITSCRAGGVVNMLSSTNQQVAMRIKLSQREEPSGLKHVTRVWKAGPADFVDDRRVVITAGYDGMIVSVQPETAIFGFPNTQLKGLSICDVIDVFADWREKSGSGDMQLLMLALVDKEQEMPGSAWRVKITPPESAETKALGKHAYNGHLSAKRQPKSAILQASLAEASRPGDAGLDADFDVDKPRVRLTLWRRELLVGSLELDEALRVRRVDQLTGLILGRPANAVLKQPLHKFLRVPRKITWDDLMGVHKHHRDALKTAPTLGKISPIKTVEGDHPDGGSLRILLQGVVITEAMSGKSRIEVAVKPDMTFAAAHSDIWGALGLNVFGDDANSDARSSRSSSRSDNSAGGAGAKASAVPQPARAAQGQIEAPQSEKRRVKVRERDLIIMMPGPSSGLQNPLPVREGSGSGNGAGGADFVKRWVQTMDAQRPNQSSLSASQPRLSGLGVPDGPDDGQAVKPDDWLKIAAGMPDEAFAMPPAARKHHAHGQEGGGDGQSVDDGASEISSQNDEQRSGFDSRVEDAHEDEILVDSRRGKVLRKLMILLNQPGMTSPVHDIKWRTVIIMLLLILIRIVCYAVVSFLMDEQAVYINDVYKSAGIADKSQVATARSAVGTYCRDRPDLMSGDNICATVADMQSWVSLLTGDVGNMEQNSQDVYLGPGGKVQQLPDGDTYSAWSAVDLNFTLYLDTNPPTIYNDTRSLWELNSRFTSAVKEMLWRVQYQNTTTIRISRAFNFIYNNGLSTMFKGYTRALDYMMVFAYGQLSAIKGDIAILMVVETLLFLPALIFWQWWLIRKAENVRMLHWMLMVSLPGPVLRALSSKPVRIVDDSDAESDHESDGGEANNNRAASDAGAGDAKATPRASSFAALPSRASVEMARASRTSVDGPRPSRASVDFERPLLGGQPGSSEHQVATHSKASKPAKTIALSFKYYAMFLGPLALWFVTLIAVYSVALVEVDGLQGLLGALNMCMHVIFRFSTVRATAFFALSQPPDSAAQEAYRAQLVSSVNALSSEYETLLYGGTATTQATDVFQQPAPAAAFILPAFSDLFFKTTACLRADQSTCYTPDSPWYEATHHGIDSMMQRIISEMTLMTQDSGYDLAVGNNTRYLVMYHIGINDLYDGLAQAAQLFVDFSVERYLSITQLQIVLLAILAVIILLDLVFVLRPYLALHHAEVAKVAGFVSHVPHEVDVHAHARRVLRHALVKRKRKAEAHAVAAEEEVVNAAREPQAQLKT